MQPWWMTHAEEENAGVRRNGRHKKERINKDDNEGTLPLTKRRSRSLFQQLPFCRISVNTAKPHRSTVRSNFGPVSVEQNSEGEWR